MEYTFLIVFIFLSAYVFVNISSYHDIIIPCVLFALFSRFKECLIFANYYCTLLPFSIGAVFMLSICESGNIGLLFSNSGLIYMV